MDLMNAAPGQKITAKAEKNKSKAKTESECIPKCRLIAKPLTMEAMEGVWKMVTLYRYYTFFFFFFFFFFLILCAIA